MGNNEFRAGYTGRMCSECSKGYYRIAQTCYKCNTANMGLIVFLFILVAFLVCSVLFWVRVRAAYSSSACWLRSRNHCSLSLLLQVNSQQRDFFGAAAFTIALNSLQISALYGEIDLEWCAVNERTG